MEGETLSGGAVANVAWVAAAAATVEPQGHSSGDGTAEGEIDLWLVGAAGESGYEALLARDVGVGCMVRASTVIAKERGFHGSGWVLRTLFTFSPRAHSREPFRPAPHAHAKFSVSVADVMLSGVSDFMRH